MVVVNFVLTHALTGPFYRIPFGPTVLLAYLAAFACSAALLFMALRHDVRDEHETPTDEKLRLRWQTRLHIGFSMVVYLGTAIMLPYPALYQIPMFFVATLVLLAHFIMCYLLKRKHMMRPVKQILTLGQIITVAITADLYANCPPLYQSEAFFRSVNSLALYATLIYAVWMVFHWFIASHRPKPSIKS